MKTAEPRGMRALSWIVASLPTTALAALSFSAVYIRIVFGRWPVVYLDTVPGRFTNVATTVAGLSVFALVPAILFLPIMALLRGVTRVRPILGRWSVMLAITWIVAAAMVVWDPYGFVDWAID